MGLKGNLQSIPLWEILQTISIGKKTGKLEIDNGIKKAEIFIENGKIVDVRSGFIEGYDALLGIVLWDKGDFVFHPEEKISQKLLNLDPLEVLINVSVYIDLVNYLGDFMLLPVRVDGLALEEEVVASSFDGILNVREVLLNSPLGEYRSLEIIKKLIKEKKLIYPEEDSRVFLLYTFWRRWRYLLEEGNKIGINERTLRKVIKDFISDMQEELAFIVEDITSSEKISWHYFYRNIVKFPESKIEVFFREAFEVLNKQIKMPSDRKKLEQFSILLGEKGDNIYVPANRKLNSNELIVSLFFNGERSLKQVFHYSLLDKIETQSIIVDLITDKHIIDISEDKKLDLIHSFYIFWRRFLREMKEKDLDNELIKIYRNYIDSSFLDVRFMFSHIIEGDIPNFAYFNREKEKYSEEEIVGFIKDGIDLIFDEMRKKIGEIELKVLLQKVLDEIKLLNPRNVEKFAMVV
uniref:DUF4388 domain-containing protein n=1 Tax=Dictyoglomus thermophilum TaxID=14 RepID=A0A7C3MHL2_DICTH